MNCLEFRRACLSDPGASSEVYLSHRRQCRECARFADNVTDFDKKLLDAMHVPVPGDLSTRVKLRQVIGDEQHTRRTRPWQWALAASIFVSVALSGFFGYQMYSTNQYVAKLRVAVLDHVTSEPDFLSVVGKHTVDNFRRVMAAFGGEVVQDIEPRLAAVCAMGKKPIAHSVFPGHKGQVTVLYINGKRVRQPTLIEGDVHHGMLVPAGRGNLAIIAPKGERLEPLVAKLKRSIRWDI